VTQPILSGGRYEYRMIEERDVMKGIGFGLDVSLLARVSSLHPPSFKNIAIKANINDKERAFRKANELRASNKRVHVIFSEDVDTSMMDEIIILKED
jgi:ATP phosphoribosyltransferase regulatory subunit HisZ